VNIKLPLFVACLAQTLFAEDLSARQTMLSATFSSLSVLDESRPKASGEFFVDTAGPLSISITADSRFIEGSVSGPNNSIYSTTPGEGYSHSVLPDPRLLTSTHVVHTIEVPMVVVGSYKFNLSSSSSIKSPIHASISVDFRKSPVTVGLQGTALHHREDKNIDLAVLVFEGSVAKAGAEVYGELLRFDTSSQKLPVSFVENGGVYSGRVPPQRPGEYQISVQVTGVASNGNRFNRTVVQRFAVAPLLATVGSKWSESSDDANGDGVRDGIQITTEAQVMVPGTYNSIVVLRAANGRSLAATVQFRAQSAGMYKPTVVFNSSDIASSLKSKGPFVLETTMLQAVDAQGVARLCDMRHGLGSTAVWD